MEIIKLIRVAIVAGILLSRVHDVRAQGAPSSKSPEATIAEYFNSGDPAKYDEAAKLLDNILAEAPRKVRRDMQGRWLTPMMRAKAYDQIERIAIPGILSGPEDTVGVSGVQNARVRAFLAAGEFDKALSAANAYYNVCQLEETPKAIELMIEALSSARGADDPEIVRRFKLQQMAGADEKSESRISKSEGEISNSAGAELNPEPRTLNPSNVLKSITVNAAPFEADIARLESSASGYVSLTALGNLLLLADRPADARLAFERAVDMAGNNDLPTALANVARAIRAEAGGIGKANAYILALREGATR